MQLVRFIIAIAAVATALQPAAASERLWQSADMVYFTLSDHTQSEGPVFDPAGGASATTEYIDAFAAEILERADALSAFYLSEENPEAYIAFLLGALTVPKHESGLQHYRKLDREAGRCAQNLNSGSMLRAAGSRALQLFQSVLKSGTQPIVPSCTQFRTADPALQLLGSYDGLSVGAMQINFVAHPDYLPHGDFLSVSRTLDRGLEQYLVGFKALVADPARYPCVKGPRAGEIDYTAVVRGAWSGAYNSGSVSESCRFAAGPGSSARDVQWAKENDLPFKRDLDSVLDLKSGLYATSLSGATAQVFRQVVDAFEDVAKGASANSSGADAPAALLSSAQAIHQAIVALGGASPKVEAARAAERPVTHLAAKVTPARAVGSGSIALAANGRLNVRSLPTTVAPIEATLRAGQPVQIYSKFRAKGDPKGWVSISPELDRWIYSEYVRLK